MAQSLLLVEFFSHEHVLSYIRNLLRTKELLWCDLRNRDTPLLHCWPPTATLESQLGYSARYRSLMADTTKRMDRAEIAKRVERAEKLLQKGKTADALQEYMQALADDPQNDNVRHMAAERRLSLQRTGEAVKLLSEWFERQVESGDNTRASLTYKKLSRYVNPS